LQIEASKWSITRAHVEVGVKNGLLQVNEITIAWTGAAKCLHA
jgi:hypothetical protein